MAQITSRYDFSLSPDSPLRTLVQIAWAVVTMVVNAKEREKPERGVHQRPDLSASMIESGIGIDVTDNKRLEEVRSRLAAIVQSSDSAIVATDLSGTITDWNNGAERLFGYSATEAIGKKITFLSPIDRREEAKSILERVIRGDAVRHHETVRQKKDGTHVDISLTVSPILDAAGQTVGVSGVATDISERKRAEDALKASEEKFSQVFQKSPVALTLTRAADHRSLDVNEAFEQATGWHRDEVIGRTSFDLSLWVDPADRVKLLADLMAGEVVHNREIRFRRRDGTERVALGSVELIQIGNERCVLSALADITERKRAEQEGQLSENRFRQFFETLPEICYMISSNGEIIDANPAACSAWGYTKSEVVGRPVSTLYAPECQPRAQELFAKWKADGKLRNEEIVVLTKQGQRRTVLLNVGSVRDSDGRILHSTSVQVDITERKLAEEALRTSEERLRLAQQAAHIGTFEWNPRTKLSTWTRELESIHGLPPGGFDGTQAAFENLLHPDDRAEVAELVEMALKSGQPTEGEWRVILPDGSIRWIAGRWQVFSDESGEPSRMIGIDMDVTERKSAELALREANLALEKQTVMLQSREELLKIFVRNVPVGVAMLDCDMRYLQVSDRWCTDYLSGRTEILGRSHHEIFPDMPERWKEIHRRALQGETLRAEEDRWEGQDGTHWARWEVRPWKTAEGAVGGILILAENITPRKQAEEALSGMTRKLVEAQEQERARIARELHDDISQRLALLSVEIGQLKKNPTEIKSRLEELQKQTIEISTDVQALSHDLHSSQIEYLDAVTGMNGWCKEFASRQKVEIDCSQALQSALPPEIGLCLFRVLQEALHNAVKHSGVKQIKVQLHEESDKIHLIVSDSGKGFDVETAKQGKGLGLTSMRERIRLVNGTISIESNPMRGTTIHACVPLASNIGSAPAAR